MTKPFPARCKDCKWSTPERHSTWSNKCTNPKVVVTYPWSLANGNEGDPCWPSCGEERKRASLFAPCGYKGKLWESKTNE